jgi:general secretion pathway protein D
MQVKTTIRLHEKGDILTAPAITQKPGQTASVDLVKEFRYPTDFTLPQADRNLAGKPTPEAKGKEQGAFPVTPTTPKEFATQPMGIQMTIGPRFEGGLIILKGEIKVTTLDGFTSAAGEVVARPIIASKEQPILLTANQIKTPLIRENRSPIFVAALPGKTYTMQVAGSDKPMLVDFTCELVPEKK